VIGFLKTAACGLFLLIALVMLVSGFVGLFQGHDDPQPAGRGRLHDAFVETQPCNRNPSDTCGFEPSAKLDLPGGTTEVLNQRALYDLVGREGAVTVGVEWVKSLREATRVRYQGRWYRAGHPSAGNIAESIFTLLFGGFLVLVAGGLLAGRLSRGKALVAAAAPRA
jgi:hypothetical protein